MLSFALLLCACVPWTVRPIDGGADRPVELSPAAYVESIWESKLLPAMRAQALDVNALLRPATGLPATASGKALAVKGTGSIIKIDTISKVGLAHVDLLPLDGRADVTLQIGPLLRGVALRDATGLIPFSAFTNQVQFADVANELNGRARRSTQALLNDKTPAGTRIRFLGAAERDGDAVRLPLRWVAPVEIEVLP
ncbi:hypothetical protein F183_A28640 [Bryobacterales bacterium F-183]|nr:hypothetical protein F183_A28640 [Bryobacterales bacterium F-183]